VIPEKGFFMIRSVLLIAWRKANVPVKAHRRITLRKVDQHLRSKFRSRIICATCTVHGSVTILDLQDEVALLLYLGLPLWM